MNEIAVGGGAFSALIVTLITVAMGGAVGWWLRRMITPQGQPDTPQELGRAWAGWVIFVSCATQLSAFIGKLDAASFFYWLIGGGAMTAVAYAAGWGYGKWFKFSGPPMSPPHDLPSAPSAGMPDTSVAEENAYARAADELETNQVDKATWARAFSESDGDAEKSKARYITLRVKKLTQQTPALNSTPMLSDQSQHGGIAQTSPVDLENNLSVLDDKDRLWKEAHGETTGQSADVSATSTSTPSNTAKANSATADRHAHGTAQPSRNELTDLYEASIGEKNTSYYLTKFAQFDRQGPGLKASWNWAAFFLVPIWALYRKMYGLFFALWGASTVATFISKLNAPLLLNLAVLAAWVAFGIYANSIYHHHLKKKIAVAQSTVRAPNVLASLGNKGGVNPWVSWVGVGLLVVSILAAFVIPTQQPQETASTPSEVPTSNPSELASALPSAPAESSQAPSDVNEPYTQMQALHNDRRYVDLAVFVQNHLIQNPKDYLALNYGGLALHAMGDMNGARLRYKNAIALMPRDPALYYNLASTYNPNTEYQTIIRILKTAQKNDPDNQLINDFLKAMQSVAQKMEAERQAEARYMKQSRSNVSNDDESDCEVKPVMTDEELQNWRTCQPKVR